MKSKLLLRLDLELKENLREISKKEQRSMSSQIVKVLSDYCDTYPLEGSKNGN